MTKTDHHDTNDVTYGCDFLFLHFLHSQKVRTVKDIITHGAATLEDTYRNLLGHGGGWAEFIGLLDQFYPRKDGTGRLNYSPTKCNLFPILTDWHREVDVLEEQITGVASYTAGRSVEVAPCFLRPVSTYTWQWSDPNLTLRCTGRPLGFGNPLVDWVVNDAVVPRGGGRVTVSGDVDVDRPDRPGESDSTVQTFDLHARVDDVSDSAGPASRLSLFPIDRPGTEALTITARVSERFASGIAPYESTVWTGLHTHDVEYEARYYRDRAECLSRLKKAVRNYVRVSDIPILLTLPDPPPNDCGEPPVCSRRSVPSCAGYTRSNPRRPNDLPWSLDEFYGFRPRHSCRSCSAPRNASRTTVNSHRDPNQQS